MKIDILTIFPEMFFGPLSASILGRAAQAGVLRFEVINIRDYAEGKHKVTDDYPYGGGTGMVMKPEPVYAALDSIIARAPERPWIVLMTPQGDVFNQRVARDLSKKGHLVIVCGHYEGVDERIRFAVDQEISIGDYVLTGGEIPALAVIDAVSRLVPGVLGDEASALTDSFADGILEGPQYTRPREFRGMEVPEVLLSGDHERVRLWRRREALKRTLTRRPDLLDKANLSEEDRGLLREVKRELGGGGEPADHQGP
ncbi:MAG: tRNA (guanosine(37)-N1)-methyltransferase TrmD [Firmicutes bacterium]|jgi:tRNA (guanine37-N1)-methyltransferase|nr:tRNA (guanosine(37)-N1)-methyltransferase TrmD [Bacillota bacterium]